MTNLISILQLFLLVSRFNKAAPTDSTGTGSTQDNQSGSVLYDGSGKPVGSLPEGYQDLTTLVSKDSIFTNPETGEILDKQNSDSFNEGKLKLSKFYKWTTIASNVHWSNWHPASCAFDNTRSSQPTQQKFTTWVKHGTTGTVGFNLGQLSDAAFNAKVDIMNETDYVTELDETVPPRSWGQEWMRWQVFQTRQRRQTCYHVVIGSGHECSEDYAYFDTYTPVKGHTQRAWRTDLRSIDRNSCGSGH